MTRQVFPVANAKKSVHAFLLRSMLAASNGAGIPSPARTVPCGANTAKPPANAIAAASRTADGNRRIKPPRERGDAIFPCARFRILLPSGVPSRSRDWDSAEG